jgi:predicted dehydrogenase
VRVYVEKPLTAKLAEAFDFVERFGPSRTLMQIGLQRRFDAALVYAKSLIDARRIGDVREIRSVLRDQYIPPATYVSPGLIVDMGIHVADEVVWLIGLRSTCGARWPGPTRRTPPSRSTSAGRCRERREDRAADPDRVLALWRRNDLDLHGGRREGGELLLHAVGDAGNMVEPPDSTVLP